MVALVYLDDIHVYNYAGVPGEVRNITCERDYSFGVLTTLWTPVPSLDLTDIDPDIVYSIELFKISCNRNSFISHKVISASNSSEENLDLRQIYEAVIVARNNVTEAMDGPRVVMRGKLN